MHHAKELRELQESSEAATGRLRDCAALLAFNCQPSRYLHDSWRDEFVDPMLSAFLFDGRFGHARLSTCILQEMGITDSWCFSQQHPAVQIGMHTDGPAMHALACCLALTHNAVAEPIRQAISRVSVREWTAALGAPLYLYVCKQAQLMAGAHFWTAPAWHVCPSTVTAQQIGTLLPSLGFHFLHACTAPLDRALAQRLRLKLPRDSARKSDNAADTANTANAADVAGAANQPGQHDRQDQHNLEIWTWINRIRRSMPMPGSH